MCETSASSPSPRSSRPEYDAGAVVGHLVHELRQPLSTIEALAYYLQLALGRRESQLNRHLEKLCQSVREANWILADAVHFLQIALPQPQRLDLNELITAAAAEASTGGESWLELRLAGGPAIVLLDPEQGQHLVRNLFLVFRRLSEPRPRVRLHTAIAEGEVRLEIRARAEHAPVDELEAMFEPFRAHAPAGSGLALASARRIAEAHGGRVELQRQPDDQLCLIATFPPAA